MKMGKRRAGVVSKRIGNRRGMTLAELLVSTVLAGVVLAVATSLFLTLMRGFERQDAVGAVHGDVRVSVERLIGIIRNADMVVEGSDAERFGIEGGRAQALCGADRCWFEVTAAGLTSLPEGGGEGSRRIIAPIVSDMSVEYLLDLDGNGQVDSTADQVVDGEDVLAVRFTLALDSSNRREPFSGRVELTTTLRATVMDRVALVN